MFSRKSSMVSPDSALPSRATSPFAVPERNVVLGTLLAGPWSHDAQVLYVGMGCFWGAEEYFWNTPGVVGTAVGYQGGFSAYPTYEEVCSGRTGHTESTLVAYTCPTLDILRVFWEHHDPTQGFRQGNDVGTQYRSAIYFTNDEQRILAEQTRDAYQGVLDQRGYDPITTEIASAAQHPFFFAEEYHQQYLHKVQYGLISGAAYRCHSSTGIPLPM